MEEQPSTGTRLLDILQTSGPGICQITCTCNELLEVISMEGTRDLSAGELYQGTRRSMRASVLAPPPRICVSALPL